MATSVLIRQIITTTRTKAKAARRLVDKLISLGKTDTLASKRKAFKLLQDHQLVHKLFAEIAPRFKTRAGGYSRIINFKNRRGDNSDLVILELTEQKIKEVNKKLKKEKEKTKPPEEKVEPKPEGKMPVEEKEKTVFKKERSKITETKPPKKFLGGLRKLFKKERDSL